jgi:hypothetical protein
MLAATACQSYEQLWPFAKRGEPRPGNCTTSELEARARRAAARLQQREPDSLALGQVLWDLSRLCRSAGRTAQAALLLDQAVPLLDRSPKPAELNAALLASAELLAVTQNAAAKDRVAQRCQRLAALFAQSPEHGRCLLILAQVLAAAHEREAALEAMAEATRIQLTNGQALEAQAWVGERARP